MNSEFRFTFLRADWVPFRVARVFTCKKPDHGAGGWASQAHLNRSDNGDTYGKTVLN